MQFRVPQFIDMEDKVIGPLTLKQFGYVLGAGGLTFVLWSLIPIKIIAIVFIVPIAGLFLSLAFLKINNRPFGEILENAFTYYTSGKIYTWKQPGEAEAKAQQVKQASVAAEKLLADTKMRAAVVKADQNTLHELSLGLDVLDRNTATTHGVVQSLVVPSTPITVVETPPQITTPVAEVISQEPLARTPITLGIIK